MFWLGSFCSVPQYLVFCVCFHFSFNILHLSPHFTTNCVKGKCLVDLSCSTVMFISQVCIFYGLYVCFNAHFDKFRNFRDSSACQRSKWCWVYCQHRSGLLSMKHSRNYTIYNSKPRSEYLSALRRYQIWLTSKKCNIKLTITCPASLSLTAVKVLWFYMQSSLRSLIWNRDKKSKTQTDTKNTYFFIQPHPVIVARSNQNGLLIWSSSVAKQTNNTKHLFCYELSNLLIGRVFALPSETAHFTALAFM